MGPTLIEVTWQGGAGAESFRIMRVLCGRGPTQVANVPFGQIGLVRPWVDTLTSYPVAASCSKDMFGTYSVAVLYIVTAVNAAGGSALAQSPTLSFKISSSALSPTSGTAAATGLAAPTPVSATPSGTSAISLVWQGSAGATAYEVHRSICTAGYSVVKTVTAVAGSSSVTYVDAPAWTTINTVCPLGVTAAPISYIVVARDASGASAPSPKFPILNFELPSVVYGTSPPGTPGPATAKITPEGTIFLTWYAARLATTYRIERALSGSTSYQVLTIVPSSASSYTDRTPGIVKQNPTYKIVAVNPNGMTSGSVLRPQP